MAEAYYIYPDVLALSTATGEERKRLCRRIAAHVDDKSVLRTLFGIDPPEFSCFYPDMEPKEPTTEDTIDTFLDRFGKKTAGMSSLRDEQLGKAEVLAEEIPVEAPAVDYLTQVAEEEIVESGETVEDETSSAIDAFLKAMPDKNTPRRKLAKETPAEEAADTAAAEEDASDSRMESAENTSLTEGLARIMIKNRNYRKALEIITELSLKNPKKSIYFADQIRFLKKLIINETKQ